MVAVYFFGLLIWCSVVLLFLVATSYLCDRRIYNGGICRRSGSPWRTTVLHDGRVLLQSPLQRRIIGRWVYPF